MVLFTKSIEAQVAATARRMIAENLDVCEIPEGSGMVLLRRGSACYKETLADMSALLVQVPEPVDGCRFVVRV